jgi:hypothetical protein
MDSSRASTFIAIYRGRNASDARLVALSVDPALVARVVTAILDAPEPGRCDDPVVGGIDRARRRSLRLIERELQPPTDDRRASEQEP